MAAEFRYVLIVVPAETCNNINNYKMRIRRGIKRLSIVGTVLLGLLIPYLSYLYFLNIKKLKPLPNAVQITNQPFPGSKLVDINDLNDLDVSSKIREGNVLIIFLSSKCSACKKDVETIARVYPTLSSKINIYGITVEKKEDMLNFAAKNNIQFPLLVDVNAELFNKLQIHYFPTKFLVKDGVIVKTLFGNFLNQRGMFEELEIGDFQ